MTSTPTSTESTVAAYAMTVLVPDVEDAQRLAAALDDVRRPDGALAVIAVPPVRGLDFFADTERQDKLDRWWAHAIPVASVPVHVLLHEEGVPEWLPGLDGRFVVGVANAQEAAQYRGLANVIVADGDGLLDIALAVVDDVVLAGLFRDDAAARLEKRLRRPSGDSTSRFRRARLRPADEVFPGVSETSTADHHPIPNVPPADSPLQPGDDARREDLVKALAETLRRLQRIRGAT
jgi:hypothetical protein